MTKLIAAARRYLGVRFRHRGRSINGLDCPGPVKAAYADCGVDLPDFRLYGPEPHNDGLVKYITAALGEPVAVAPVSQDHLQLGDVIVLRFEIHPHHVALVTDYPLGGFAMLHADGHTGRVIEHRLADKHISHITHVFRKPL